MCFPVLTAPPIKGIFFKSDAIEDSKWPNHVLDGSNSSCPIFDLDTPRVEAMADKFLAINC